MYVLCMVGGRWWVGTCCVRKSIYWSGTVSTVCCIIICERTVLRHNQDTIHHHNTTIFSFAGCSEHARGKHCAPCNQLNVQMLLVMYVSSFVEPTNGRDTILYIRWIILLHKQPKASMDWMGSQLRRSKLT
jgi:hypothetical protein